MTNVIEKFTKVMQIRNLSQGTQSRYLDAIEKLARCYPNQKLEDLSEDQVQDYLLGRVSNNLSQSTLRQEGAAFRLLFNTTLKKNPQSFLIPVTKKKKKLPYILSRGEVSKMFRVIAYDLRKTAYFSILYGCGLRGAEACNLRMCDIDSENRTVWVRDGKGGKDRGVFLPESVYISLANYWKASRFEDYIFVGRKNSSGPMHIKVAQNWLGSMKRETGIAKPGGLHLFRHSYATHALEDGVHLLTIKKHLGHSSLRTTLIYLELAQISNPEKTSIDRMFESMAPSNPPVW